jgi:thiol-disulfide isomerase/thioredoxin
MKLSIFSLVAFGSALLFSSCGETPKDLTQDVVKHLAAHTNVLEGGEYKKVSVKNAEKFILYYSASWCPPCRASAPTVVELYNSKIVNDSSLELVHMSADRNQQDLLKWATKEKFPWPTVFPEKVASFKGTPLHMQVSGIPTYFLVSKDGKLLAEGKQNVYEALGW